MVDIYDPAERLSTDGGERQITDVPFNQNSLISFNLALYLTKGQKYPEFEGLEKEVRDELIEIDNIDELAEVIKDELYHELAVAVVDNRYIRETVDISDSYEEAREITTTLIEDFPMDESVVVQAALWQRALVMLHLFNDANHRTGLSSLRDLLEHNDVETFGDPLREGLREKNEKTIETSKEKRNWEKFTNGKSIEDIKENPYEKDSVFGVWVYYFSQVLDE